jgi:5-methylcytosine-specific restriction endonuclease McrA
MSKESDSIYSTPVWKSIRNRQLSTQPLCQSCLITGRVVSANTVDHVFAWQKHGKQSFTQNLFQSLCHDCHSYKTGQEKQGKFIHYKGDQTLTYTSHDYQIQVMSYR